MSVDPAPRLDLRRRRQLRDELVNRARGWLPDWRPRDGAPDFASALFEIAARLGAEVTQRLDKSPEKSFRGFLHWLGVRGAAGRAARLPVVFGMSAKAEAIDAESGAQLQASLDDALVTFETETDLRILPAQLTALVGTDPDQDAFTLPSPEISPVEQPAAKPNKWALTARVDAGGTRLQLDPELGLDLETIIREAGSGLEYRIVKVESGIVTIEPPTVAVLEVGAEFDRVARFDPFAVETRNRQQHALYIGAKNALNLESAACIEVLPAMPDLTGAAWHYWGKQGTDPTSGWQKLTTDLVDGRLLLWKQKGAIEEAQPDSLPGNRWIRASGTPDVHSPGAIASKLQLKINCELPDPGQAADTMKALGIGKPSAALEAMANTTPLVLNLPFYPLGREPRQFDAFYLGCKEAFSKPRARIDLHFDFDDGFATQLATIGLWGGTFTVAVGKDHRLKRLRQKTPGAPLDYLPPLPLKDSTGQVHDLSTTFRPGLQPYGFVAFATVDDGKEIWRWGTSDADSDGAWFSLKAPPPVAPATTVKEFETLLVSSMARSGLEVYARADTALFRQDAFNPSGWLAVPIAAAITRIAPVVRWNSTDGQIHEADGIVALSDAGELYLQDGQRNWTRIALAEKLDQDVTPLVIKAVGGNLLCFAAVAPTPGQQQKLIAFDLDQPAQAVTKEATLAGKSFSFAVRNNGEIVAMLAATDDQGVVRPSIWAPFQVNALIAVAEAGSIGPQSAGPVSLAGWFLFPGDAGNAGILKIDPDLQASVANAALTDAAIFDDPRNWSAESDLLLLRKSPRDVLKVGQILAPQPGSWVFELERPGEPAQTATPVEIYKPLHTDVRAGMHLASKRLELARGDTDAAAGGILHITWGSKVRLITIDHVEPETTAAPPVAVLARALPAAAAAVSYRSVGLTASQDVLLRPLLGIGALSPPLRAELDHGVLSFPALNPQQQRPAHVFAAEHLALLAEPWNSVQAPNPQVNFLAFAAFAGWQAAPPPRPRNPGLSWEYWNGTNWWHIAGVTDGTDNFVTSGDIQFCVPDDLQQTDVAGRTNFWIRARLVGGDYGKETVKITNPAGPIQTVERVTDGLRPPYAIKLDIKYELCCPVTPDALYTKDNGTIRNQSDANRAEEAVVRYFVPLAAGLAHLGKDAFSDDKIAAENAPPAPSDCIDCATGKPWSPGDATAPSAGSDGRALFLGFDSELSGGPIHLLFLVTENENQVAKALRLDALYGGQFKPVGAMTDGTLGLSQSGVVAFNLAQSPQRTELFGRECHWLRLRPNRDVASADWQPQIGGVYLNAAWARATETQLLERLGSSDGAPGQTVTLARPPVLLDSLELRVREPLTDEDIEALRRSGEHVVKDPLGPWPGSWVLWREVPDVADCGREDRVYALDDESGTITFGDGQAGMIPPIGQDSIVAARYQKVGGAAANKLGAWGELRLVTPLQGVERVIVPQGAAGGANPQDAETAIRFAPANLNLRGRALALRDFEILAMQFSPLIGQVRAFSTAAGIRVVTVMRGTDPVPGKALRRELESFLAARASPMLSLPQALRACGPTLVPLRVSLRLAVADLELSGDVTREALARLQQLFDPAIGGLDGTGWRLGALHSDADIAAQLVDIAGVETVDDIRVQSADAAGAPIALPTALKPTQLLHLPADGVRINFVLSDEMADA